MTHSFNQSIAIRVVITIVAVVTVLLTVVGTVGFEFYKLRKQDDLKQRVEIQADQLAAGIALAVWNFDNGQINKILESSMKDHSEFAVSLEAGDKHYSMVRDSNWNTRSSENALQFNDNLLRSQRDVKFNEEIIGILTLFFSDKFLQQELNRTRNIMVGLVISLDLILILSLYTIIWQRVLRPLKLIENYAVLVSSGRKEQSKAISQPLVGEFAELYASLEKMVALLESRLSEVKISNDRFWKLIRGFPFGLVLYRPDNGRIEYINKKFTEVLGYTAEDIPEASVWFHMAYPEEEYRNEVMKQWETVINTARGRDDEVAVHEYAVNCKDGSKKNIEIGGVAAGEHILVVFNDITERSLAEQEVRTYQLHLEELVQKRTEELVIARDLAESANRSKSQFLANMSHELRTPLNSVIGFSKIMANDEHLSQNQQKNLEIINRAGNHLLTLINDILELSKIEAGKQEISVDDVDINFLAQEVREMLLPKANQQGISLNLSCPGISSLVVTDEAKLRQILINLVSNAIKFTYQGEVNLRVAANNESDRLVVTFKVADTGIGIPIIEQNRIFEPFEQIENKGKGTGTGLGLAISRKYVHMLGGELVLESSDSSGSIFSFTLDLAASKLAKIARTTETEKVIGLEREFIGYRILIADDNDDMRELLNSYLLPLGFEIYEASNGEQARDLTLEHQPQLVFLDWRMPKMDGLTLAKAIRADNEIVQPIIIMLSANAFNENKNQALQAGVDDFMGKPIDMELVYNLMEKHAAICFRREKIYRKAKNMSMQPINAKDLSVLTDKTRKRIVDALSELSPVKISEAMDELRKESAQVAEQLSTYVDSYQYRELWNIFGIINEKR